MRVRLLRPRDRDKWQVTNGAMHSTVAGKVLMAYFGLSTGVLAVALASRALYYSLLSQPDWLEKVLEDLLQSYVINFQRLMGTLPLQGLVFFVLLLGFIFWRRPFWSRHESPPRLRPWVYAALGTLCALNHYLFDADPLVAKLCFATIALFAIGTLRFGQRSPATWRRVLAAVGAIATFGVAVAASPTPVVTLAILFWGAWLALMAFLSRRRLVPMDTLLFALIMVPVASFLIPTFFIYFAPNARHLPGTALEERGYAYGYCEVPSVHKLFMTVPIGETGEMERMRDGYIAEYDTRDFSKRKEHTLFNEGFYGGLRMAFCLGDTVQVTMNGANIDGTVSFANVLEFSVDDPQDVRVSIFDEAIRDERGMDLLGHDAVYDAKRDALFLVSEWTNTMYRVDRESGELNTTVGHVVPQKEFLPFVVFGLQTTPEAVHQGRRTFYVSEWADGSRIYEIHLDTLRVVRILHTRDTGSFDLSVDETGDRLISSGLWGINVFDLETGEIVARMRTGPGARTAVVDARRDLIYVPTTLGGHIWVLDRVSLLSLGRLTTGLGGRPAYLTLNGRHFFASDQNRTYRWDAEELARRFGKTDHQE